MTVVTLDPPAEAIVLLDAGPTFERIEVPDVRLRHGEVLVVVELATVCGSDLHTVLGRRSAPTPLVLGHEQVGRVMALGPGDPPLTVDGVAVALGNRVVWGVAAACGECRRCTGGFPNKCETLRKYGHDRLDPDWTLSGGLATHVHLLVGTPIVVVGEDLPATVVAPASCATATVAAVIAAATGIRSLAGATVLVSGCGMLGLTAIAMAHERGARIVAVDPDPSRRELARRFGADRVADSSGPAMGSALAEIEPSGVPAWTVALELSGSTDAIDALLPLADVGAVLVLAGSVFPSRPVALDAEGVVRGLVTIRGVHNYLPEHLVAAVTFLERADHTAFAGLVGEIVDWSEATRALVERPTVGARTAVVPRVGSSSGEVLHS